MEKPSSPPKAPPPMRPTSDIPVIRSNPGVPWKHSLKASILVFRGRNVTAEGGQSAKPEWIVGGTGSERGCGPRRSAAGRSSAAPS